MTKIYFDNNATTPLAPEVKDVLKEYNESSFGNPSSIHWAGQEARKLLNQARDQIAHLLNCEEQEIIFTSGATESINTALRGLASLAQGEKKEIVSSPVEHHATLKTLEVLKQEGFPVHFLKIDRRGNFDLEELKEKITEKTLLCSLMWANNETGNIYPIEEVGKICRERGVFFHCDAVQAIGKLPLSLKNVAIDFLSLSAHKFHGPKGTGLLYVRRGCKFAPLIRGGNQERNLRAGTQNLGGILGMAKALELSYSSLDESCVNILKIKDKIESFVLKEIPGVELNGDLEHRLCNTSNFWVQGVDGESLLFNLDLEGIAVSAGAACESGSIDPSHVLMAMGRSAKEAKASLRISLSKYNSMEEVGTFLSVLPKIIGRIRKRT